MWEFVSSQRDYDFVAALGGKGKRRRLFAIGGPLSM
jgi:hypothetical protein